MIDWNSQIEAQKRIDQQNSAGSSTPPQQQSGAIPSTQEAPAQPELKQQIIQQNKNQFLSGGTISDIFDVASIGSFYVAGAAKKVLGLDQSSNSLHEAGKRGVQTRQSWIDIIKEKEPEEASAHPIKTAVGGTTLDILADPAWLVPPAKVVGGAKSVTKGIKTAGRVLKSGKAIEEGAEATNLASKISILGFNKTKIKELGEGIAEKLVRITGDPNPDETITPLQNLILGLTVKAGRPLEWSDAFEKAGRFIGIKSDEVIDLAKRVKNLPENLQKEVADVMEGRAVASKNIEVNELAKVGRDIFGKFGEELNQVGKLTDDTIAKFGKTYLPKFVEKYEDPAQRIKNAFNNLNSKEIKDATNRLKKRTEVPTVIYRDGLPGSANQIKEFDTIEAAKAFEQKMKDAGKVISKVIDPSQIKYVEDVPYRIAKGGLQEAQLTEYSKLFQFVDKNWAKTSDQLKEFVDAGEDVSAYTKMPDSARYGELANKYVPAGVWYDLNKIYHSPGKATKMMQQFYGAWKAGKVIYNPATHVRNMMSNALLNDMGGVPIYRMDTYYKTFREYLKKGDMYQEAKALGLGTDTYFGNEIADLFNVFNRGEGKNVIEKLYDGAKGFVDRMPTKKLSNVKIPGTKGERTLGELTPSNLYEAEEEFFKLAHYIHQRGKGLSPEEAFGSAQKWLFNYKQVPDVLDKFRKMPLVGQPFVTFSYKVVPRIAETMATAPTKISKFGKIQRGIEETSNDQQVEEERRWLPEYMQQGSYIRLPDSFKDEYGRVKYLDMGFIYPWGATDVSNFMPGGPVFDLVRDLQANKNVFNEQPIWNETDTDEEKRKKQVDYIVKAVVPPLAPGGSSYEKMKQAVLQAILPEEDVDRDYYGRKYDLFDTLLETLGGVKTREIDIDQEKKFRGIEFKEKYDELRSQYRSIQNNKGLTESSKQQKLDDIEMKLNDLEQQWSDISGE